MRYTDFTYEELRERLPRLDAAFIPLGCTEQQGPHLPTDFDTWMITRLCGEIADTLEREHGQSVAVLPTLPFGPTPEHAGFGFGYVNLRQSTHEAVVEDVLQSLAAQGFSTLVIWRGCGQHDLGAVIDRFNASHQGCAAYREDIRAWREAPLRHDRAVGFLEEPRRCLGSLVHGFSDVAPLRGLKIE